MYRTAYDGKWNTKMLEIMQEFPFQSEDTRRRYCESKSDKYLGQTPAEFYAEVDRTVGELQMSMSVVSRTINAYFHNQREAGHEGSKRIDIFLSPLYAALRNKGYNKSDLWG
ncbi:MAG: hypothetical protein Q7R59_02835 [bacterium]|nr:hypothetical protein [bacterium]